VTDLLLPGAVLGPAAAAVAWAGLAAWRWPRRVAGGLLALAAHAAGWAVFWQAYRGEPPAWRSLDVTLLGATVLVATELAVILAALRAEGLGRRAAMGAMPALGVGTTAVAFASFSTSLVIQAVFVPVATVAATLAGLSGSGRRDLAGVLGLAAADAACLGGLALLVLRLGTVVVAPTGSLGMGASLVLVGAAIKAGVVPGVGTWRLAATSGPGAPVAAALRGQGIALAVLAGVIITGEAGSLALAAAAAAAALACGVAAAVSTRPGAVVSGLSGAGASVPFVALGLGGAVGVRAFLLSFPAVLLGSGAAFAAAWPGNQRAERVAGRAIPRRGWVGMVGRASPLARWVGVPAALLAAMSLGALPGGGGHPGTALAVDLAGVRAQTDPWYLAVAAALLLGLGMAALAATPVVAAARPPVLAGVAALLTGGALLYIGSQPVRLGLGWWLRIEQALEVPALLPSSGAPAFPSVEGINLALVLAPAAGLALLVAALGRGVRAVPGEAALLRAPRLVRFPAGLVAARAAARRFAGLGRLAGTTRRRGRAVRARAQRLALGLAVATVLEAGAVALSVFLVMEGVRLGFL
jgi:hypothetical protein